MVVSVQSDVQLEGLVLGSESLQYVSCRVQGFGPRKGDGIAHGQQLANGFALVGRQITRYVRG